MNKSTKSYFDTNNIESVELDLLDGQVEIILRALELYGYNLEFMLDSSDTSDESKQEKLAMLKYTYEQILSSQAEQVQSKSNNRDNLSNLGKNLIKNNINSIDNEVNFKVV